MNIVILGTAYPYRGGLASYNERLALEFQKEGHIVKIITFRLQYPGFLFPGKTQYSSGIAPEGLHIERLVNSVNPLNWVSVGRRLKRMSPDLIVVKFWLPFMAPCLGTISRIARRNGHTRTVSILDNIIPHEKRIGDRMLASYFVNSVDAFVAMSKSVLRDICLFDEKKPRIFSPHPLFDNFGMQVTRQCALERLHLDSECRYLLFFGLIRDYKGLDTLLDAFSDARLRNMNLRLIIAGEFYGDGERYHRQAGCLGIDDKICWFTHFIPDEEVRYFFSAADIVVQPYKSATQSGVTQIAYHFEKPMIVTDVGGLGEIVPDGKVGFLVRPDAISIADAIVRFYEGGDTDRFISGIREEKKRYSWASMCERILTL